MTSVPDNINERPIIELRQDYSRVFYFHNDSKNNVQLLSANWMDCHF